MWTWKSFFALLCVSTVHTRPLQLRSDDNSGIHLAVQPRCGQVGGNAADLAAGIRPEMIKTIVSFGDSFSSAGKDDGSPQDPPVIVPPNPLAGGRSTNGFLWVEDVALDLNNAAVKNYAQAGACTDLSLWPSNPRKVDFIGQVKKFLSQGNNLDPSTTLYTIFFGINDYLASLNDGDHMQDAANSLLNQIQILASPPTNASSFMVLDVYGRGTTAPSGETFKQTVFSGLSSFRTTDGNKLAISYVDFSTIWNGVVGPDPGFQAFGYVSKDSCTKCTDKNGCSTIDACSDPDHFFEWFPGHPSKVTHRLMADYVREVWSRCAIAD